MLAHRYGDEAAVAIGRAADEVVDGIGAWCATHGVDAWYAKRGYLRVNAFPGRPNDWDGTLAELVRLGLADALVPLPAAEVQRVCASPAFGDGLLMPSAASVQPARLARGLRRVLLERGVQIAEGTRALRVDGRGPLRVSTESGSVTSDHVVLAINAWAAGWPGFRTRLLAWGSDIVLTEPIPDRLAELGWTGGELLSDSRFTISYFRTTADGRIAFGGGVGSAGFGGRIGHSFTHDHRAIARVVANLDHLLPTLRDVRLTDAWGGPIDITGERFPEVGSTRGGRLHFAHGFAGNGVGPSRLAGRILAALAGGHEDPVRHLAFVGRRQPFLPPEPVRYLGARIVREALIREDDARDAGRRPSLVVRAIARLPRLLGYQLGH
jgi:glycine/D-amino acid oxidase-like deaminating enzyme